jgi:hypothetical protein
MIRVRSITKRIGSSRSTLAVIAPTAVTVAVAAPAAAVPRAVVWGWLGWVTARFADLWPIGWWWFGRAGAAGFGVVRQRSFMRLRCTRPILRRCGGRRRSERLSVSGFGRKFS